MCLTAAWQLIWASLTVAWSMPERTVAFHQVCPGVPVSGSGAETFLYFFSLLETIRKSQDTRTPGHGSFLHQEPRVQLEPARSLRPNLAGPRSSGRHVRSTAGWSAVAGAVVVGDPRGARAWRWRRAGLGGRMARRRYRCRNEVRPPSTADSRGARLSGVVRRTNSSTG